MDIMCTLIVFYKKFHEYPVLALHNRYEKIGTVELPPRVVKGKFKVFCPVDVRSRGSWIGFNEKGLFAAVTDQHTALPVKTGKSRGELILAILKNFSIAEEVVKYLEDSFKEGYKRGNFVILDSEKGYHVVYDEDLIVREIKENLCVITNIMAVPGVKIPPTAMKIFEDAEVRRKRAIELSRKIFTDDIEEAIFELKKIAADHGEKKGRRSICYHSELEDWVMMSSTIIAVARNIVDSKILYCKGNPCENTFQDYSHIIKNFRKM